MSEDLIQRRFDQLESSIRKGVRSAFLSVIAYFGLIVFVLSYVINPLDSTDSGFSRSGLKVHVDAQTGCEYLSTPSGAITPRLSGAGEPTGCNGKN